METLYTVLVVWLMSSAALGVGSSTLAVASFLTALKDGTIDPSERRMLGVVYTSLRAAMVMIAIALLCLNFVYDDPVTGIEYLWFLLAMLTINSFLMTKHWISFKLGPALQAATWYTLGFVLSIEAFELIDLSWVGMLSLYCIDFIMAVLIINGLMMWQRSRRKVT